MEWENVLATALAWVGGVLATSITNEVLETILLVLSALSISFSFIVSLVAWIKEQVKDKKVDEKDLQELAEITKKASDDLQNLAKGGKDNGVQDSGDND